MSLDSSHGRVDYFSEINHESNPQDLLLLEALLHDTRSGQLEWDGYMPDATSTFMVKDVGPVKAILSKAGLACHAENGASRQISPTTSGSAAATKLDRLNYAVYQQLETKRLQSWQNIIPEPIFRPELEPDTFDLSF